MLVFTFLVACFITSSVVGKYPMYSYQTALARLSLLERYPAYYEQIVSRLTDLYHPERRLQLVALANDTMPATSSCLQEIWTIVNEVMQRNISAYQWIDAMGKPLPGISVGAISWPGSFGLCMSMSENIFPGFTTTPTKYCSLLIQAPLNVPLPTDVHLGLQFGLCFPRSCSAEETQFIVKQVLSWVNLGIDEEASYCHSSPEGLPKDRWFWLAIALLIICFLLLLAGSISEVIIALVYVSGLCFATLLKAILQRLLSGGTESQLTNRTEEIPPTSTSGETADTSPLLENRPQTNSVDLPYEKLRTDFLKDQSICFKLVSSFSWPYNLYKLCTGARTKESDTEGQLRPNPLSCLDGIRVCTMCWIMFGHCIIFTLLASNNALIYIQESFRNWTFQVMVTTTLAVDTFYLMSGLLTFYLIVPQLNAVQGGHLSRIRFWSVYILHRYLRLTLPYIFVMLLYTGLFIHLYDGPLFPQRPELTDIMYCRQHGWITYLSNFFYTNEQCMPWTWYLANEFQFSVFLAPIFITIVNWKPMAGGIFAGLLLISSMASTFGIAYINEFLPGILTPTSFEPIIVKPYTRWGTYVIGLVLGWILLRHKHQGTQRQFTLRQLLLVGSAFALASIFCLSTVYGLYGPTSGTSPPLSTPVAALYTSMHRPAFALGIAIVVYLCATGNALPISALLSWSGFRVASRLTYGVYLVHPIFISLIALGAQTPFMMTNLTLITLFFSVAVISFVSSIFLSLVTEAPIRALERLFCRR